MSRYGLIAYASSLDQIGPVGKDVSDCAALLEAVAGYDEKDSTSVMRKDLRFTQYLKQDLHGVKTVSYTHLDARTCLAFGVFFFVFNRKQAAGFSPMPGTCSITEQRVGV